MVIREAYGASRSSSVCTMRVEALRASLLYGCLLCLPVGEDFLPNLMIVHRNRSIRIIIRSREIIIIRTSRETFNFKMVLPKHTHTHTHTHMTHTHTQTHRDTHTHTEVIHMNSVNLFYYV